MEADQTPVEAEAAKPTVAEQLRAVPRNLLIALAVTLFLLFCLASTYFYLQSDERGLKPPRTTATPNPVIVDGSPIVVTFEELNTNASEYQNKWIQVTGNFFPQDPTICNPLPSNGPQFNSVLVSEGLQLNVQGGQQALAIMPINSEMVVQGVWRLYSGPAGCGKEPPSDMIWYLDIRAVVQPNPIVANPASPLQPTLPADLIPPGFGTPSTPGADQSIPTPTHTPIPVTVVVNTPVVTNTPTPGLFGTPTVAGTPTPSPTNALFTRTPTPDPNATATSPAGTGTPTVTNTPGPGTVFPTNTPGTIPTATQGSGYPGITPAPSNTPGGYP